MKKIIASLVVVTVLSAMGWLVKASISKIAHKKESNTTVSTLSRTLSALKVSSEKSKEKTVIVYFNSECDHCRWEVQEISKNKELFADAQLMFISHEPRETAVEFLMKHDMASFYLEAKPEHVLSTFSGIVPQLYIYQGEQLKERFHGEVKMELILEALK